MTREINPKIRELEGQIRSMIAMCEWAQTSNDISLQNMTELEISWLRVKVQELKKISERKL